LFWGVTAGALDSMVANYTALRKPRSDDPYAPAFAPSTSLLRQGSGQVRATAGRPNGVGGGGFGKLTAGRPDRAVTVYCNLIRKIHGKAAFIVAGGLEAGLRRFAHYDFLSDSVRRPLLMDCGANILVHGMGEGPVVEIAKRMPNVECRMPEERARGVSAETMLDAVRDIPGVVYRVPKSRPEPADGVGLPSAEEVAADPVAHARAYRIHETNRDKLQWQNCGGMRVIANPPWIPSAADLDRIFALPFTREAHPRYGKARIPALESVQFSVTTHRGCFGGCAFCAIGAHQGKAVVSRSKASILDEVKRVAAHPGFHGTISDLGGPTANMYGLHCKLPALRASAKPCEDGSEVEGPALRASAKPCEDGSEVEGPKPPAVSLSKPCDRVSCLWPELCKNLEVDQRPYLNLLQEASRVAGVKHLFVSTGVRMDLALLFEPLIRALALEHTSGNLKVAPEHITPSVLNLMRKPSGGHFEKFLNRHRALSRQALRPGSRLCECATAGTAGQALRPGSGQAGREQFVLPYFIAAHPGCTVEDMIEVMEFLKKHHIVVEQCQIFTPTPGTASTVMYATGLDPATLQPVVVEKREHWKQVQKALILYHLPESRRYIEEALTKGRRDKRAPYN
jgi:radical SAM superfamily enzyme YgiQ (UPF0313 family)